MKMLQPFLELSGEWTERARGLGRKMRERKGESNHSPEIPGNQTALRFQTGPGHQTSQSSLHANGQDSGVCI